jgi:hypothetical protein
MLVDTNYLHAVIGGKRSPRRATTCRWRRPTVPSASVRTSCWAPCCPAAATRKQIRARPGRSVMLAAARPIQVRTESVDISLDDVHQALVELSKFRFGEMRVEDAIGEIVRTTHAMFDVDGAGLMLVDADQHLRSIAASDGRFAHLEELQIRHQEGPCIDAFEIKELVGA